MLEFHPQAARNKQLGYLEPGILVKKTQTTLLEYFKKMTIVNRTAPQKLSFSLISVVSILSSVGLWGPRSEQIIFVSEIS